MVKNRKAQAAMEFLMTYGWAILVVLAAIAALAYFGVLSPDKFLPSKCNMPSGFGCVDFLVDGTSDDITLVLQNGAGFNAEITGISVAGCTDASASGVDIGATNPTADTGNTVAANKWINGDKLYFRFECSEDLVAGDKFQGDVTFNYMTDNGLSKSAVGDIVAKVE